MRTIQTSEITKVVKDLCIQANKVLPCDLVSTIRSAKETESNELGKSILGDLLENLNAAKELDIPICQDTGMAIIFVELGQEVHLTGGLLNDAINEGVRQGYIDGCLRCSIVKDPINRVNTNDNTPAIIHLSMVAGDQIHITVAPKGFGSENMSAIKMFTPSASVEDMIQFVCKTVKKAGSNPCPPIVVGVGIGGDFEHCAYLAKKALCTSVSKPNEDSFYAELENRMLSEINKLGVGVQGFGGDTTALAVKILQHPTHIAGLPVAVNIGCHVTRHKEKTI
ncbi:fumarate hydratase [Paludicola sp. MB14-C6]|uniref:fumarate hydratase n=1 Tax=Paludihabitans sp. MB14-C6 TaxID=3070656 RepID=UPI0027DB60E4|nr:fumarate hydratase [Paludicola sp. MB14-C6]WMJ22955.1 fumarate hydratase [Paludicola sp. MB14-C6]